MPLSALKVLELNKEHNLIDGLCKRELENPEGVELELRVGKIAKIVGDSYLGVKKRYSPKTEVIADIKKDGEKEVTMKPGDYFLVGTIEKINCPSEKVKYEKDLPPRYLMPNIYPRTSLFRGGVILVPSITNPGYKGSLTFGLYNAGGKKFTLELGSRMFKIVFEPVIGEIKRAYSGQHQSGRTTSQGEEELQN
ncbi:hypothetical protein CMI40_01820 [Candidatus Pacearchaeota archaeon]|nr:hypothetical protein [Candidatus Pacearchaeota archaeon]|tara:strand:- start:18693 stop:19274 length:582 start_codon:yes stop_codon:yes gene_type:complete